MTPAKIESDRKWNFNDHELLHTVHIIRDMFNDHVITPKYKSSRHIKRKIAKIDELLNELYQDIGAMKHE